MVRRSKPPPEEEPGLFEVALDRVEREVDADFETEVFEVDFDCTGPLGVVHATVTLDASETPTLEIIPKAMSELHRLFQALADQSRAWLIEKP